MKHADAGFVGGFEGRENLIAVFVGVNAIARKAPFSPKPTQQWRRRAVSSAGSSRAKAA
jgi:hypothetical protein